ncbi:MAG TPA: zinc ribbon domain-containing protein [Thermoanaerobaculia bacterium]|nr:zinc ribbon domain-containing protein [Thermoanaerobaculia bacterium]
MSETERIVCVACSHEIDAAAKLCPYCGADPRSGQKVVDTEAVMQEMFPPKAEPASRSVMEYARQRQGVVAVLGAFLLVLLLAALHGFVTRRNESLVSANAAVPLTDVTDLNNQSDETKPQPMPELKFQYDGRSQTMRTLIVEPGAVAPPQQQTTTQR